MRNRRGAIGVLALLMLAPIFSPSLASADPTPAPSPSISRTPLEQFKFDREQFMVATRQRDFAIRVINQNFKMAIDKSTQDFRIAMQSAKTPDQKFQATNNRKNAVNLAISARDAAITALGPEPTPPAEPPKAAKTKSQKDKGR
jgi:hypothetical protein